MLVESAWVIIRHDRVMSAAYGDYCKRMKQQEAIIRRLSNRVLSVLKSSKEYEYDKYC